jgi:hypothetical protein
MVSVLGIAWLSAPYPSFRKACAIVLGISCWHSGSLLGSLRFIAIDQRHQQAVQAWRDSDPARQTNNPVTPTSPCIPDRIFNENNSQMS